MAKLLQVFILSQTQGSPNTYHQMTCTQLCVDCLTWFTRRLKLTFLPFSICAGIMQKGKAPSSLSNQPL